MSRLILSYTKNQFTELLTCQFALGLSVQHARFIASVKRGHFWWLQEGKHAGMFFKCVLWAFMGVFPGARRDDTGFSVARLLLEISVGRDDMGNVCCQLKKACFFTKWRRHRSSTTTPLMTNASPSAHATRWRENRRAAVVSLFRVISSCLNHVVMSAMFIAFIWDSCYAVQKPLLSNIKKQVLGFEEGKKKGRLEETLCSLSSQLPYLQSFNRSTHQKHSFNI